MAESTNRQKHIFLQALDLDSSVKRAAFLAEACGSDEALRRQVEAMLKAHDTPDSFLEKPAAVIGITVDASSGITPAAQGPGEGPGTRIGPYKLLQQIGEGGMGVVFMAEQQEPVRRIVALKIIKPGMDGGQVLARFEAERQALALMDHPNIAKVLDAGATTDGRPFFVMELVKGTPITAFCDANKLSPRERLELFIPVCQAIQHAHQKGVIHRDIKPSNVLIALYDDKPVPKVIDFGIAKATGLSLTERTLHTGFGALVGTPEYMSPEQATFNQLDIDTRSDVYSLGVLVYELLTGTTPVDKTRLKEAAILEVLRVVREEEPKRPSVKLSTTEARASIAATRGTDPGKLAQLLRGELDWIVMKALEKDRNRRYETAAGFARDVDRYLKDELVEARPPSLGYRLGKTLRKNRGLVSAVSLVLLTLIGGIIGTTLALVEASRQRDAAEQARQDEAAQRGLANKARGEAEKLAEKEKAARALAEELACQAKFQARRVEVRNYTDQLAGIKRAWKNQDFEEHRNLLNQVPMSFRAGWEYRYLRSLSERKLTTFAEGKWNEHPIARLAFNSDGKYLAAARNNDNTVGIWDVRTKKQKVVLQHSQPVLYLAASKQGDVLAAAGNNAVKVWNFTTGEETLSLEEEPDRVKEMDRYSEGDPNNPFWKVYVSGMALSPDGKRLAVACLIGKFFPIISANILKTATIKIRDTATGKVLQNLDLSTDEHKGNLQMRRHTMAFSSDGQYLVATKRGKGIHVWDTKTGEVKKQLPGFSSHAVFSPDDTWIVAEFDKVIKSWNWRTGEERFQTPQTHYCYGLAFHPDGKRLVAIMMGEKIRILGADSGKELASFKNPGVFGAMAVSPNGKKIAASSFNSPMLWEVGPILEGAHTLDEPDKSDPLQNRSPNPITGIAFTPDSQHVFACNQDGTVKAWDLATAKHRLVLGGSTEKLFSFDHYHHMSVSPDGKRLVRTVVNFLRSPSGDLPVHDTENGQELFKLVGHKGNVSALAFSPDGRWIVSGGADHAVKVWHASSGKLQATLTGHTGWVKSVAISPDSKTILSGGDDKTARFWDLDSSQELRSFAVKNAVVYVTFCPDGLHFITGVAEAKFSLREIATGREKVVLGDHHDGRKWNVTFSPDGQRMIWNGGIRDSATGLTLHGIGGSLSAFSPDGKRIVTGESWKLDVGSLHVWEAP